MLVGLYDRTLSCENANGRYGMSQCWDWGAVQPLNEEGKIKLGDPSVVYSLVRCAQGLAV
jgi:hypothetical protein